MPPRKRDPGLPRDLEAIVMKALAEDPRERYQSVGELAGDLERFMDVLPVSAYREGLYGRAVKFVRRHRAPVLAASVMLVAILLTGAMTFRAKALSLQAEEAERRVEEERQNRERTNLELVKAEEARRQAEEARRRLLRRRAAARVPMEKGMDIMDKSKAAVDKERDQGRKLQLLQPAIDFFSEALAILEEEGGSIDSAEAYYARARAYEQAREIGKAKEDYRRAFQADESYVMAHYYLGLIHFNVDRNIQSALAEFAAMNEIDPGNEFSEVGQAYIEAHTGRDTDALARVDRIEARERAARGADDHEDSWRNPGLYTIWLIRGLVHGRESGEYYDPEKAVEAYSNYVLYDPDKPAPYVNRGSLRLALRGRALRVGDHEEAERQLDLAIADFSQALAADPSSKLAYQHRGFALFKFKNLIEEGLADVEKAIELDPKYTTAILDRAAIRETQGRYDLAEKDYLLVKEIQPGNRNVDYRLGILYLYTNKLAESEAAFDTAVEMSPSDGSRAVRLHRRGIIRFLRGRYPESVEDFNQSLALRSEGKVYPALMRWLAQTRMGEKPDPEDFARQLDVGPDKPWLAVVGSIYLGEDPFGEDQAMRLADTPEARCEAGFYLGARAWARGETVNALYYLQQAVDSGVHLFMEYSMAKILAGRLQTQQENAKSLPDQVGPPAPAGAPAPVNPVTPQEYR